MDRQFREALLLLDIDPEAGVDPLEATQEIEAKLGRRLPASVVELVRYSGVIDTIAQANDFHGDFPRSQTLADGSYMPDVEGPVLWLQWENRGVVVWGTPLERGDNPPVLVGWGASDRGPIRWRGPQQPTVEFAPPSATSSTQWHGTASGFGEPCRFMR